MNVNRLIPSTSGNKKDTPVLPPMVGIDPGVTSIAAIPVYSQRARSKPVYARALVTQRSPRKAPRQDVVNGNHASPTDDDAQPCDPA
jgi:hypothetical protein